MRSHADMIPENEEGDEEAFKTQDIITTTRKFHLTLISNSIFFYQDTFYIQDNTLLPPTTPQPTTIIIYIFI